MPTVYNISAVMKQTSEVISTLPVKETLNYALTNLTEAQAKSACNALINGNKVESISLTAIETA